MYIHLKIIGAIFVLLSALHIGFPKKFEWQKDLAMLSLINRQIMQVHTFFIALFVLLNGLLFFFYTEELIAPQPLSKVITRGLFIFWGLRCLAQHFFYSTKLWQGKKFETIVHVFFSLLWVYVTIILGLLAF
jgi:hypothetical protein